MTVEVNKLNFIKNAYLFINIGWIQPVPKNIKLQCIGFKLLLLSFDKCSTIWKVYSESWIISYIHSVDILIGIAYELSKCKIQ